MSGCLCAGGFRNHCPLGLSKLVLRGGLGLGNAFQAPQPPEARRHLFVREKTPAHLAVQGQVPGRPVTRAFRERRGGGVVSHACMVIVRAGRVIGPPSKICLALLDYRSTQESVSA
jgi:hypothetical protein